MKKILCMLLCLLMLPTVSFAEGNDNVTEGIVYDAADSVGTVVNGDPVDTTVVEQFLYRFTPLDVVLVIDVSGSMATRDASNGKSLLDYAKQAGESFRNTLMNMNPGSRIGLVSFSDNAGIMCDLVGLHDQNTLVSSINRMSASGSTNTGDGYVKAIELLRRSGSQSHRKVVIMITDGLANTGIGDPIRYCIDSGEQCAQDSTVYTIGLVGGMTENEKRTTRSILEAGYETRYFEVDFDNVSDAGAEIDQIVMAIAMSTTASEAVNAFGESVALDMYQFNVGAGFDARITAANGEVLSSFRGDYSTGASYGSMSVVDGRKHFVVLEGDYVIDVQGVSTKKGGYTLSILQGESMRSRTLHEYAGWSHVSLSWRITIEDGHVTVVDTGYNVLNPYAKDRNGKQTIGLEESVGAMTNRQLDVMSAPARNAKQISTVQKNDRVRILAESGGFYYISFVDDKGCLNRGWIVASGISEAAGFVPEMYWLDGEYVVSGSCKAYGAPEEDSAVVQELSSGTKVVLKHVERSSTGEEWAYVQLKQQNPVYGYVSVENLKNWVTIAPRNFRIGHDLAPFTDELSFEAVYFARGQMWQVYSAPNTSSWRGAKGKAEVSTNDVIYVAGWNRGWLLIAYETNNGNRRVGYVDGSQIQGSYPDFPVLVFRNSTRKVSYGCTLTDDPVNESADIRKLKSGDQVTQLSSYTFHRGYKLAYVQCTVDGKTVRGFIPADCIE